MAKFQFWCLRQLKIGWLICKSIFSFLFFSPLRPLRFHGQSFTFTFHTESFFFIGITVNVWKFLGTFLIYLLRNLGGEGRVGNTHDEEVLRLYTEMFAEELEKLILNPTHQDRQESRNLSRSCLSESNESIDSTEELDYSESWTQEY